MRIGILGGTFDPVHVGHLVIAEQAQDQLALDEVIFIPAGEPWRKADRAITPGEHRLSMLRLAIDGNDDFGISDIELRRSGPSYTADTLEHLASERLDDELWFVVGSDALADMPNWRDPERIVRHARLAVTDRSDAEAPQRPLFADRVDSFTCPSLAISSTGIRADVRSGKSIRYLVPEGVRRYIAEHGLYRPD